MSKSLIQLSRLALPVIFAAACEKIIFDPVDVSDMQGSTGDIGTSAGDLSGCSELPYTLVNGFYPALPGSGIILTDTCGSGITSASAETPRSVMSNGPSSIVLYSSDGSTVLGAGPLSCNRGMLGGSPKTLSDGRCRFTANYLTDFQTTANNSFTVTITQTRTNPQSEPGQFCTQPASCVINYRAAHKM